MFNRVAAALLLLCGVSAGTVNPASVTAKVHSPTPLSGTERIGTAWCLNKECSWMVTNYHVAQFIGKNLIVNGESVESVLLATGPDDEGARDVASFTSGAFKYASVRDLAILKMKSPMMSKGMHGVRVFAGRLQKGQPISIISYPGGKLTVTTGRFDITDSTGLLQFQLSGPLAPGSSGGLILNDQDEAVGVVMGINTDNAHPLAYAVPIWSLAEFVKKSQPEAYAGLFPAQVIRPFDDQIVQAQRGDQNDNEMGETSTESPDHLRVTERTGLNPISSLPSLYLNLPPAPAHAPRSIKKTELHSREEEIPEIQALRQKAQDVVRGMTNLIALQTVTQGNSSVQETFVRVIDGQQIFVLPDGRQVSSMPGPKGRSVVPGSEWKDLPETVGTNRNLPLYYLGERTENGLRLKVFYFEAAAEDKLCSMRVKKFWKAWTGTVPCHGEVWTDADLNILRISEQMEFPAKSGLQSCSLTILYGWLRHDRVADRLVPASMRMVSKELNSNLIESSIMFSGYHQFHSTTKIMTTSAETPAN